MIASGLEHFIVLMSFSKNTVTFKGKDTLNVRFSGFDNPLDSEVEIYIPH